MNTEKQDPRGVIPGGQHDSSGGTRVTTSLPPGDPFDRAIERLHDLDDGQLAEVVATLDAALSGIHGTPAVTEAQTAVDLAASARILLRRRQQTNQARRAQQLAEQYLQPQGGGH
jgi:hypothetical protein